MSRYLRDYKVKMLPCGILEFLEALSFNLVAMDGLQPKHPRDLPAISYVGAFEETLKTTYAIEDSSKVTRRGF